MKEYLFPSASSVSSRTDMEVEVLLIVCSLDMDPVTVKLVSGMKKKIFPACEFCSKHVDLKSPYVCFTFGDIFLD